METYLYRDKVFHAPIFVLNNVNFCRMFKVNQ